MASNNDEPRRDRNRPEDNPFIAFRRFADSQVSSLLNSVLTLPSTIATFNNAQHAREHCLFGRADPEQCKKLQQTEDKLKQGLVEAQELFKAGELEAVMKNVDEAMKLKQEADTLTSQIVEDARGKWEGTEPWASAHTQEKNLAERVGNRKGQEWGWSWDWGFPRPFDEEDNRITARITTGDQHRTFLGQSVGSQGQIDKRIGTEDSEVLGEQESRADEHNNRRRRGCRRWRQRRDEAQRQERLESSCEANPDRSIREGIEEGLGSRDNQPKVWSWSFTFSPPADSSHDHSSANDRPNALFDELGNMIVDEVTRMMLPRPFTFYNETYSPRALEDNKELHKARVQWRDAFEDLVRAEQGASLIPEDQIGQASRMSYNQWARRFWDPDFASSGMARQGEYPKRVPWESEHASEEPSYEYSHDHEDQHDDPPTPKPDRGNFTEGMPETELEVYERLLGPFPPTSPPSDGVPPSILSTLTTTERTVAPDGTVMTKVVLKTRFADGREQSSETVHTQNNQDAESRGQDPWKAMQEAQFPSPSKSRNPQQRPSEAKDAEKKRGWFWSN